VRVVSPCIHVVHGFRRCPEERGLAERCYAEDCTRYRSYLRRRPPPARRRSPAGARRSPGRRPGTATLRARRRSPPVWERASACSCRDEGSAPVRRACGDGRGPAEAASGCRRAAAEEDGGDDHKPSRYRLHRSSTPLPCRRCRRTPPPATTVETGCLIWPTASCDRRRQLVGKSCDAGSTDDGAATTVLWRDPLHHNTSETLSCTIIHPGSGG